MCLIHFKGHQPSLLPSVSATANVYLAKVKLDPEWFLLVLKGFYMSPALPSVTFPLGFAITGAPLSVASEGGRYPGKGVHLNGSLEKMCIPILSGYLFHLVLVEGQRKPIWSASMVTGNASMSIWCAKNFQITEEGGGRVAPMGHSQRGKPPSVGHRARNVMPSLVVFNA